MVRRRVLTIGASLMMLVGGIVIVVAALAGVGSTEKARTIPPPKGGQDFFAVRPTSIPNATATPEPQPTPEPSGAPIDRLVIPKIGVNAGVVTLSVDKDGVMQDPKGPKDVAWYDFSQKPGWSGNAVFAGHVDYVNYGPAVFWNLRNLEMGDEVKIVLSDGTEYSYHVISEAAYSSDEAPVQDIVGPTDSEVVTIITCNGTFNTKTREYDKRLIVRAERSSEPAAQGR
jgi:sortase A